MNYWLLKTEPDCFSWQELVKKGSTVWDGVRNYAARNNLKAMAPGDLALFYHSITGKEVVGIAEVVREAFPDPTTEDNRWVAVEVVPHKALPKPVTLETIKADPELAHIPLVKNSRLSVQPLEEEDFQRILRISEKN